MNIQLECKKCNSTKTFKLKPGMFTQYDDTCCCYAMSFKRYFGRIPAVIKSMREFYNSYKHKNQEKDFRVIDVNVMYGNIAGKLDKEYIWLAYTIEY